MLQVYTAFSTEFRTEARIMFSRKAAPTDTTAAAVV